MGLDINLFREDRGNDPQNIKDIQKKRFKSQEEIDRVDTIVKLDKEWRSSDFQVNQMNKEINQIQKQIGMRMKNKESADDLIAQKGELNKK